MYRKIWLRVLIPLILGLCLPFVFLYYMFETMGISEYVWPILFPILSTIFGIFAVVLITVGIACRAGSGIIAHQSTSQPNYHQPPFSHPDIPSTGASYVIPLYCPYCGNQYELNRLDWIGTNEFSCPRCYNAVQVGIREDS